MKPRKFTSLIYSVGVGGQLFFIFGSYFLAGRIIPIPTSWYRPGLRFKNNKKYMSCTEFLRHRQLNVWRASFHK